jgi:hypothetical protein
MVSQIPIMYFPLLAMEARQIVTFFLRL